jgi:leucyl-tRNA synthetase
MDEINFAEIEKKWQDKWEKEKTFEVSENSNKEKFYVLEMFPYPSGSGLHMGHAWNYTIGDILARFKIMQGFNVLHPMGYDALGLPAENAAIQAGTHPEDYTNESIINFTKQFKSIGLSYDWSRMVNTASPEYYKWDQWIFLKMFEKGLAYQKESAVNWCPKCNTVLANEQVRDGKCWRHEDTSVKIKHLKQWFLKITDYADELYENLDNMDWPERTRAMQKNWIGKSHGTEIDFEINGETWPIFTTRPDTIFGVTFMVVSAQHTRLDELVTKEQRKEVDKFLKKLKSVSEKDVGDLEKEGVFTGSYATNPANGEKVPIYAGNFVVADYGAGMVMAVPAHDRRDYEFAKKYKIEIKQVIEAPEGNTNKVYTDKYGVLINSGDIEKNKKLLNALKKIKEVSDKVNIDFWLLGGLACGFYYGKIYRKFGDLDLIVKGKKDYIKFCKLLENNGYVKVSEKKLTENLVNSIYKNKEGIEIDIGPNIEEFGLNNKDFEEQEKELGGVICKVLSKRFLLELKKYLYNKRGYEKDKLDLDALNDKDVRIEVIDFNGLKSKDAIVKITEWLTQKGRARSVVNFRLRDWGVSRQRYWGTPIPIIHCDKCGAVPVPEKDLPIALPKDVKFGDGNPLETNDKWLNVKCPKCGGNSKRESDTMDTFVNSSWYFLRFCDPNNNEEIFDKEKAKYWSPVDTYIGGAEHTCMHLIYSRFYVKFLRDLGLINFDEPAKKLFHQGMLSGEGGVKMSKSKPETCILPEVVSDKYGIDTARFFLSGLASPDKNIDWSEKGINGSVRFLKRIIELFEKDVKKDSPEISSLLNETIRDVTVQLDTFEYRPATIRLKELFDLLVKEGGASKKTLESALKMLSPFCPHITEELWEKMGNKKFISLADWPKTNESKILKKGNNIDLNSKIILDIKEIISKVKNDVKNVYLYVMPFELEKIDNKKISKDIGKDVKVFSVNDSEKYDPENKSKRAKPGKVSVYLE